MLRCLARLICLTLVIGLVVPMAPVAAAPMRHSAPMTPDCATPNLCCDTGAPCAVTCTDRCLATMPTGVVVPSRAARSVRPIGRLSAGLTAYHSTPEPPVPRLS
ncbi:hypothetical protein [Sphingomonas psychrolutea]|uniref:hypothetical protein n=1 Tax=Sphingomonas psychrolutea TaxID=1259676 RepID=UPI0016683EB7|nr:hypothetical protein [Sphingomonas psychrolutea]